MERKIRNGIKAGSFAFDGLLYVLMTLVAAATLYPFVNVLALSFNDPFDAIKGGIYLFPRKLTLVNYAEVLSNGQLLTSFYISALRTVLGTGASLVACSMVAYVVSRREFMLRRFFSLLLAVTMYVGGGLIPDYLLTKSLGLFNNFLVYILPGLIGVWNVFVIRTYIDGLPESLQESARIDGANDLYVFFRIVLPLCIPVLATVSLFIAVYQWNSWFDTYLYCTNRKELSTMQYELQKMLTYTEVRVSSQDIDRLATQSLKIRVTPESLKHAMTIIASVPIMLVYPFVQKYFITGITLGAVKS
jgi:putative aldouronate transport system permease protein